MSISIILKFNPTSYIGERVKRVKFGGAYVTSEERKHLAIEGQKLNQFMTL